MKELLEVAKSKDMLSFVFGSLISADNNLCKEDIQNNLLVLDQIIKVLPSTSIDTKWLDNALKAKDILEHELNNPRSLT